MPELEGIPHRFEIPIWHRGPARIVQNKPGASKVIVLDQRRARLYAIVSSEDLLFDLERVTDEESALQFVGKYGLLSETESLSGIFVGAWVMPLDQFLWVAKSVRTCLQIYRWLRPALDGDPDALAELRKLEAEAREITGRSGLGVELDPAGRDLILALKQRATKSPGARATDADLLAHGSGTRLPHKHRSRRRRGTAERVDRMAAAARGGRVAARRLHARRASEDAPRSRLPPPRARDPESPPARRMRTVRVPLLQGGSAAAVLYDDVC